MSYRSPRLLTGIEVDDSQADSRIAAARFVKELREVNGFLNWVRCRD